MGSITPLKNLPPSPALNRFLKRWDNGKGGAKAGDGCIEAREIGDEAQALVADVRNLGEADQVRALGTLAKGDGWKEFARKFDPKVLEVVRTIEEMATSSNQDAKLEPDELTESVVTKLNDTLGKLSDQQKWHVLQRVDPSVWNTPAGLRIIVNLPEFFGDFEAGNAHNFLYAIPRSAVEAATLAEGRRLAQQLGFDLAELKEGLRRLTLPQKNEIPPTPALLGFLQVLGLASDGTSIATPTLTAEMWEFSHFMRTMGHTRQYQTISPKELVDLYGKFLRDKNQRIALEEEWRAVKASDRVYTELLTALKIKKKPEIVVAVFDAGFDLSHPALRPYLKINRGEIPNNNVDDDGNGFIDDFCGYDFAHLSPKLEGKHPDPARALMRTQHGNHVSGIILRGNDNVRIVPINIISGYGVFHGSAFHDAVTYVQKVGAKFANMSVGVPHAGHTARALKTMEEAKEMGFYLAAGNDGQELTTKSEGMHNPLVYLQNHRLPNMTTVAWAQPNQTLSPYSNHGGDRVTLAARGGQVAAPVDRGDFGAYSGTSMASPNALHLAVRLATLDSDLTPQEIRMIQIATSTARSSWQGKVEANGTVDEQRAMRYVAIRVLMKQGKSFAQAYAHLNLPAEQREHFSEFVREVPALRFQK